MTHTPLSTIEQATAQRGDHGSDTRVAFENLNDLARQVFARQLELRGRFRDSLRVGVTVGHLLSRAKEICPHGEFQKWLKEHFEGSARHAQRLMTLAHEYPRPEDIPTLSLREALRLIAGRTNKDEKHLAHQRLSRQTVQLALRGVTDLAKALENKVIATLKIERVTAKHPAMKSARNDRRSNLPAGRIPRRGTPVLEKGRWRIQQQGWCGGRRRAVPRGGRQRRGRGSRALLLLVLILLLRLRRAQHRRRGQARHSGGADMTTTTPTASQRAKAKKERKRRKKAEPGQTPKTASTGQQPTLERTTFETSSFCRKGDFP